MIGRMFSKNKLVILYGASLAAILLLLKWLEFRFVIMDHAFDVYIGAIALLFTCLGIWLAIKLNKPKTETIIVEKEIYITKSAGDFIPDEKLLLAHGISKREWEVLRLMSEGLSNQEIASRLFLSLNTIKTHSSKLFEKLDAKRRTQAIEKAKRMGLLA
jgi:two-component system, NarL family, response regulator LiaR